MLCLPVSSQKRVILIKDACGLKAQIKDFILKNLKTLPGYLILIFDAERIDRKDPFLAALSGSAKVLRFKEEELRPDAFALSRQIQLRRPEAALKILNQLLKEGEKPERILGGLRYSWEREIKKPAEKRRHLRLLLDCDLKIKTGKIKALFALERLVLSLSALSPQNR